MKSLVHLISISIFLAALPSVSGITQQSQERIIKDEERVVEKLSRKPAPLKVKVIKTKKGEFLLGKKFVDNEDWFQGLSVVLENISDKNIIYVGAGFLFPRQDSEIGNAPPLYKSVSYGQHPNAPSGAFSKVQPLVLKPKEAITITLSDLALSEIKNGLKLLSYAHSIKTIKFNLEEIYFDDGTGWAAGTWFRRNGDRPVSEQQPLSGLPKNRSTLLSLRQYEPESTLKFLKANLQQACTESPEEPRGEIGRCGVYDGFYSRRCCAMCCPALTNCYKREAWIRPG